MTANQGGSLKCSEVHCSSNVVKLSMQNKVPYSAKRKTVIISTAIMACLYAIIAISIYVYWKHVYPIVRYPLRPDGYTMCLLVTAVLGLTVAQRRRFSPYTIASTLALPALLFVFLRVAMVTNVRSFDPSTHWWKEILHRPLWLLLCIAMVNSLLTAAVIRIVWTMTGTKRHSKAFNELLLRWHAWILLCSLVVLLLIFWASHKIYHA